MLQLSGYVLEAQGLATCILRSERTQSDIK